MDINFVAFNAQSTFEYAFNSNTDCFVPITNSENCSISAPAMIHYGQIDEDILRDHTATGPTTALGYAFFSNVYIGRQSFLKRDGRYLLSDCGIYPSYFWWIAENNVFPEDQLVFGENIIEVDNPVCVVSGLNDTIYGHFLLETFPRVLLASEILNLDPTIKVLVPHSRFNFVKEVIDIFIPQERQIHYDDATEVIRCKKAIVPTMFGSKDHVLNSASNKYIWDVIQKALSLHPGAQSKKHLMVERIIHPYTFRSIENYEQLLKLSDEYGLSRINPGTLPFLDQVRAFSNATLIVAEYSSASHNSLFMPFNSRKIILNWVGQVESRIAALRQQSMHYISPIDRTKIGWSGTAEHIKYQISVDDLRRALEASLI